MRILHIIKATRIGGAERHLLILLSALRGRGVDAHLLMLVEPNNLMTEMIAEAEKRSIPVQRLVIAADWDISVIARLRRVMRQLKPDIVHTHLIHADLFGLLAAKLAGIKIVLTGRHNDDSFRHHGVVRRLNGLLWRGFSGGIAISESIRAFTTSIEDAPPAKVRVVTYGFEYTAPQPDELSLARKALLHELILPQEALIIGMACRLVEQKGVTYALQAFARIYADFPHTYLLVAGEGDLKNALEAEAQALGIMPRMRWLGWRSDVPALLAGLDIFLIDRKSVV